jgi:exopolysaccharide biosynthesis polyprenyl glycosylphosphotransferase
MRVWALIDHLASWRPALSRLGDAAALGLALAAVAVTWDRIVAGRGYELPADWLAANGPWLLLWFLLALVGLQLASVYDSPRTTPWLSDLYGVASGLAIAAVLTLAVGYFAGERSDSRLLFVLVWAFSVVALVAWRLLARVVLAVLRQHGVGQGRQLVIGGGAAAQRLIRSIERSPQLGYVVVGHVDEQPSLDDCRWLGQVASTEAVIDREDIHEVIIAGRSLAHPQIMDLLAFCRARGVRLKLLPDTYELALTQVALEQIDGHALLRLTGRRLHAGDRLKRLLDLAVAAVTLLALAPLLLLIAAAIRLESAGPVVFRQTRVGRGGRHFTLFKFRSMVVDAEARLEALRHRNEVDGPIFKMREDPRVTRVGRWLRRTSLDELPQLLNVLLGDMSLVGPRPAVPSEVAQYAAWQRARLEAIPGITGLWQVSGRSQLSFEEMVRLDIEYVERRSLLLDLAILLRTVPVVLTRRGAY